MSEQLQGDQGPTDTHRFFAAPMAVYEGTRAALDLAFGHPRNGTVSCLPPFADARKAADGLALVALENAQCAWPEVSAALADLLAASLIRETTRAEWEARANAGQ